MYEGMNQSGAFDCSTDRLSIGSRCSPQQWHRILYRESHQRSGWPTIFSSASSASLSNIWFGQIAKSLTHDRIDYCNVMLAQNRYTYLADKLKVAAKSNENQMPIKCYKLNYSKSPVDQGSFISRISGRCCGETLGSSEYYYTWISSWLSIQRQAEIEISLLSIKLVYRMHFLVVFMFKLLLVLGRVGVFCKKQSRLKCGDQIRLKTTIRKNRRSLQQWRLMRYSPNRSINAHANLYIVLCSPVLDRIRLPSLLQRTAKSNYRRW